MGIIEAKNLVKEYKSGVKAVNAINFEIQEGECFGFLGPNGAGKTTTVKMIYCFSPVTAGELTVMGMNVQENKRQIKAALGIVPQEDNLDPELSVWQNLIIYASYFDIKKIEAERRAEELLEFFGLEDKRKIPAEELSGGMKRRLTIARALINNPCILILDEPTTGLDPQVRRFVWQKLRQLKNRGITMVLTTHYLEEASQLCDRLLIMDQGTILEEGSPRLLVDKHIGREVLELSLPLSQRRELLTFVESNISGFLELGDTLYIYPLNGQQLLSELQEKTFNFRHQLLRPANLEDVFLKLTGRGFADA